MISSFNHAVLQLQCFGHSAKNCRSKQKCLICGENLSHKGCPSKESRKPKCANCKGPHVASYKGCPKYKKQAFRQHVVNNQKTYASTVSQNTLPQPKTNETFTFTAEQLTKIVANVVIQIDQPEVCYPNPKQDTLLGRICLNHLVLSAPLLPLNHSHSRVPKSTQVSKTIPKAPTVLKSTSPPNKSVKAAPKQLETSQ